MAKVDYRRLDPEKRKEHIDLFLDMLQTFGLREEGREFLRDLLMESEVTMFARRIQIAKLLLLGWRFQCISMELHAGLDTIQNVDRWLNGKFPRYRRMLCPRATGEKQRRIYPMSYTLSWARKKYPMHFLLINVLLGG